MELSDYMRRVLRWSWLIAVITVAGGIIALLLTAQSSMTYVTTATVAPPAEVDTASEAQQYVNDFQAASGSRSVQAAVQEATEVPRDTVAERVIVSRVGDSGLVSVSYQTPIKDDPKAEPVVAALVDSTLQLMYQSRVDGAQRGVTAADADVQTVQKSVDDAQARVNDFLAARQYVSPVDELTSVQDQLTDFRIRETSARASGDIAAANTFAARLAELEQRRADLARDALAYNALVDQVDTAKQTVARAQEARETAVRAVSDIKPAGNTTFGKRNEPADRAATIWRRTLAVMLACFVLSILLVAWLASLTPARKEVEADEEPVVVPDDEAPAPILLEVDNGDNAQPAPSHRPREPHSARTAKRDPDGISISPQPS